MCLSLLSRVSVTWKKKSKTKTQHSEPNPFYAVETVRSTVHACGWHFGLGVRACRHIYSIPAACENLQGKRLHVIFSMPTNLCSHSGVGLIKSSPISITIIQVLEPGVATAMHCFEYWLSVQMDEHGLFTWGTWVNWTRVVVFDLVVVWAEPGFSGPVLLFGLNWFGV